MRTAAELTLGREADAVPKARRFVGSSFAGEAPGTVHAVELVVTELVTNSLLHGEPPVSVRLIHLGESIRVEVEDAGPHLPVVGVNNLESMTGRGLALVAALSSAWGVDPGRRSGKVVWAELPGDGAVTGPEDGRRDGDDAGPAGAGAGTGRRKAVRPLEIAPGAITPSRLLRDSEPRYMVRLDGVPTALLLSAKAHIDSVVRELTLLRGGERSRGADLPPALASLVETVTGEFGEARTEIKRQALAASARGDVATNLELRLPLSYADAAERYLAALDEADRYARSARLLTLAPPMSHRAFRRWYVGSLVEQLRAIAAGLTPEPPQPLSMFLAAELDQMERELGPTAAGNHTGDQAGNHTGDQVGDQAGGRTGD